MEKLALSEAVQLVGRKAFDDWVDGHAYRDLEAQEAGHIRPPLVVSNRAKAPKPSPPGAAYLRARSQYELVVDWLHDRFNFRHPIDAERLDAEMKSGLPALGGDRKVSQAEIDRAVADYVAGTRRPSMKACIEIVQKKLQIAGYREVIREAYRKQNQAKPGRPKNRP